MLALCGRVFVTIWWGMRVLRQGHESRRWVGPGGTLPRVAGLLFGVSLAFAPRPAKAWIISEHERIGHASLAYLPASERATLQRAWTLVRSVSGIRSARLCPGLGATPIMGGSPDAKRWCVGLPTLPAIAADHSCSPAQLRGLVESGEWLVPLLVEGATVASALRDAGSDPLVRFDLRRDHDIRLQLVDDAYLERAQVGGAHFQLARAATTELLPYLRAVMATGQRSNALALYLNYHLAALALAQHKALSQGQRARDLWQAFTAEAFALHFLQDAFSAGHFVGSWGDPSQRKGTHDHYSRAGVEARTWQGRVYVAHGDAYLKDDDARYAADAGSLSLAQLAHAMTAGSVFASGVTTVSAQQDAIEEMLQAARKSLASARLNACTAPTAAPGLEEFAVASFVTEVLGKIPMAAPRHPALPRFRQEFGPFWGVAGGIEMAEAWRRDGHGIGAELSGHAGIRFGLEASGVLSRKMYGRVFLAMHGVATTGVADGSAIAGFGWTVHAPFAIVPGDGLLLLPLSLTGARPVVWLAQHAGLGTIYGHVQRPLRLSNSASLQFVLGREASFRYLFGRAVPNLDTERFELLLPALSLSYGDQYTGELASGFAVDLGARYVYRGYSPEGSRLGNFFGFFVSASAQTRGYF